MNYLETKILEFIKKNELIDRHDQLMVAVSGGIDSTATIYALARLNEKLQTKPPIIAHINHKLRGAESERDEIFVKKLAEDLGLHFISESFDIKLIAKREKRSIQDTARKFRLRYLEEMALKLGCNKIATGHNQDDLAETTLMWIARGAGLKGGSGISPKRGKFIRPLLCCSRQEISSYAKELGLIHVEDSSNFSTDYIRNVLRQQVLPIIEKKCYPGAKRNIARFAELLRVDSEYLEDKSYEIMKNLTTLSKNNLEISIDIDDLMDLHPAFQSRIVRQMISETYGKLENVGYGHIQKIIDTCLKKEGGLRKVSIPGEIEAIRTYSSLLIRPYRENSSEKKDEKREYEIQYPGTTVVEDLGIKLDTALLAGGSAVEKYVFDDPYTAYLSFDRIKFPLKLRKPRTGDSFIPLGSSGTKKLSDYFIDSKIAQDERWHIPVITDVENIIWIVGHRVNDLYRISPKSKNVLMIKTSWL